MTSSQHARLTRMQTVLFNAGWNMLGRIGPVAVALLVTPPLIDRLGLARWGVLTIALSLVGTFGIFDFGLGRALTRAIAERITDGCEEESASLTLTGILTLGLFGLVGGLIAALCVRLWVYHGLKIPADLRYQTMVSMWVLCATAPLVMINAAMWGVMSAYQAFRTANLINIPISIMYYLGPLLILQVWDSLVGVMLVLALCRLAMTVGYGLVCLRIMPSLRHARPAFGLLRPLFRIGGWMTISNLMFPILSYMDRFMIATVLSAAVTGYYTTAFDVVARLSMITMAVTSTAYPAMAACWRTDTAATVALYRNSILTVVGLLFPFCLIGSIFSHDILALWVGADFARHSTLIMKCLSIGVFVFGMDAVAAGFLDGIGRAEMNAMLSVVEVIVYIPLLLLFLHWFGVNGAAFAWASRSVMDCLVRIRLGIRLYSWLTQVIRHLVPTAIAGVGALLLALPHTSHLTSCLIAAVGLVVFYVILWRQGLADEERNSIRQMLGQAWTLGRQGLRWHSQG
ncbi:flippase [Novacetimonas pomaceti]|uniref:Flippase n=1 Tax=Novacetimonas pomaceti TaxID=2021998 RepID=A0A318Q715_9PROT|nr:flippase [Novacetimonas pomaceti]MBV1833296.1 flippase [Novacetimonas pomaceti]PYD48454.1 flippase [Novacetimonas pomaceti]PYD75436.1 flippase [Novacetimonas pomaceti]